MFSFMKLREKFTEYLKKRISVAKIHRVIKSNLHAKKLFFIEKAKNNSAKLRRLQNLPKKSLTIPKDKVEKAMNAYDVFNSYLQDDTPTKPLNNKSIEKAFAAQSFLATLNNLFRNAKSKHYAFNKIKQQVFFTALAQKSFTLDMSIQTIKIPVKHIYTKDAASKNQFVNGVKKLSDFVFKHKESAFYHLKARTVFPDEDKDYDLDRTQTRESCKSRISQFFAVRKSRNMRSVDSELTRNDISTDKRSTSQLPDSSSITARYSDQIGNKNYMSASPSKNQARASVSPNTHVFSPFSQREGIAKILNFILTH